MEIRYPNYYRKFHCIAGDCPDTCCAGWEISVDRASENRYRAAVKSGSIQNKAFARKLKKHIRHGRIISEGETCPFCNQDGLCEMYMELGPESLCQTCAHHPRHLEDYGNLHEIVLLLSCPEVARLILEENTGGFYTRMNPERQGNTDGIEPELLELLLKTRDLIWKWNADESVKENEAMMLAVALAHDLQRRLADKDYAGMGLILERYDRSDIVARFREQCSKKTQPEEETFGRFLLMSDFMEMLSDLDTICRDWPEMLELCRKELYHSADSRETYGTKQFHRGDTRNLFEYFIYSFLLPTLYDGDLLSKVKMAVLCTMAVEELYKALESGDIKSRVQVCHAIGRQIENCDENRAQLETNLKQSWFGSRRIIHALLESEE